jgi:hypothetical protein
MFGFKLRKFEDIGHQDADLRRRDSVRESQVALSRDRSFFVLFGFIVADEISFSVGFR